MQIIFLPNESNGEPIILYVVKEISSAQQNSCHKYIYESLRLVWITHGFTLKSCWFGDQWTLPQPFTCGMKVAGPQSNQCVASILNCWSKPGQADLANQLACSNKQDRKQRFAHNTSPWSASRSHLEAIDDQTKDCKAAWRIRFVELITKVFLRRTLLLLLLLTLPPQGIECREQTWQALVCDN